MTWHGASAPQGTENNGWQVLWQLSVRPVAIAVTIGSVACEGAPSEGGVVGTDRGVTVRDSAGIEIVENHAPERASGQFWTLDREPDFVLGGGETTGGGELRGRGDDRDGRIWQVRGLAMLVDGRIAVLSQGSHQLFIFEPSGRLSKAIGGRGDGPGEFVLPERMQYLPPDTLAVWDHWMGPITYFDTAGTVLKRRRIDLGRVLEAVPRATVESPAIPLPDGSFVVAVEHRDPDFVHPRDGSTVRYPPIEYVRVDLETYVARSLGVWDGQERWAAREDVRATYPMLRERSYRHNLLPFDEALTSQLAAGGHPPTIYITNGDRNEIRQFSLNGTLLRIIRRTTAPIVVTDQADRAWRDHALGLGAAEWGVEDWPKRKHHPAISSLSTDPAGMLWVREWSASDSGLPDQWSVFDTGGRWVGVLRGSPAPWLCYRWPQPAPCWTDRNWLLVLRADALGQERIEGYRIHKDGRN